MGIEIISKFATYLETIINLLKIKKMETNFSTKNADVKDLLTVYYLQTRNGSFQSYNTYINLRNLGVNDVTIKDFFKLLNDYKIYDK